MIANGASLENMEDGFDMSDSMSRWAFIASAVPLLLCIWYGWNKMGKQKWYLVGYPVMIFTGWPTSRRGRRSDL
jgi:hypothetical protein